MGSGYKNLEPKLPEISNACPLSPMTIFSQIRADQYEAIKKIVLNEHKSIAEVVREALDLYLESKEKS